MLILKQSTASQSVLLGPFVDDTDGATAETGLTIANTDIRLSKNGGNMAAKNSGGGTHDENGWYTITLDATDTNTVGSLQVSCKVAGALAVFMEFQVVEEAVYDAMFASSAAGPLQSTVAGRTLDVTATGAAGIDWGNVENPTTAVDLSGTDIQLVDTCTTNTDMRGTDSAATAANLATAQADLDTITGTDGVTLATSQGNYAPATVAALATVDANVDAILVDTGTTLPATLSTIDGVVDAILAMLDDPRSEPAAGAPAVNADAMTKLDYLYKWVRNKKDNDGSTTNYYADDGSTVDHTQTTSESGGTVTKSEIGA